MSSPVEFIKKYSGLILVSFFLIVGLCTFRSYGLSWDEPDTHDTGEMNFNYMVHHDTTLLKTNARYYGAGFELPVIFLEHLFKIKDSRSIYLFQHIAVHVFFLLSAFVLFLLVDYLYKSKLIAAIAFLLLVINPIIYGHSFFNSKDIPFLSMFIICFGAAALAFDKYKLSYFALLGSLCGFLMNFRILGVLLTACIIAFLIVDFITAGNGKANRGKIVGLTLIFLTSASMTLYATWPAMYAHPLQNFEGSLKLMSKYPWEAYLLFNGTLMHATSLPWYYATTWFLISNPLLYLALGVTGIVLVIVRFFRSPQIFFRDTKERNNLLYLACFFGPLASVVVLHSVIYDGWRHLYFIYPSFILLAAYGLNELLKKKWKPLALVLVVAGIGSTGYYMISSFPFEHVYFNRLAGNSSPENLRKKWELDYWGTSYKQGLEYILNSDKSQHIKIAAANLPGEENVLIMPAAERQRITIVDSASDADYFMTNYRYHPQEYPYLPAQDVYSIKVMNSTILRVFRMH